MLVLNLLLIKYVSVLTVPFQLLDIFFQNTLNVEGMCVHVLYVSLYVGKLVYLRTKGPIYLLDLHTLEEAN